MFEDGRLRQVTVDHSVVQEMVDAGLLHADDADVSIAGSGSADVHARNAAQVAMMGSGDAVVHGGARCTTSKMGSGSVRCGGGSGAGN